MSFSVKNVTVGGPELFLIAGPCVIESQEHALFMASAISEICRRLGVPYIFKASYDKANRTSLASYRGPGIVEGLRILGRVREEVKVPVLTDVHEAAQATAAGEVVDVLQIPAFLCRQTDLLAAAAHTGKAVNIKKGQFVAPQDMRHAVQKVVESGNANVSLTERGASFGYHNLVVDMRSLAIMRQYAPVVFDATHSVQLPSQGAQSGGQPEFIPLLSRAAVASGIDGIFMEVHDNPAQAKSDGANAMPLAKLEETLRQLLAIRRALAV
ncbi:MAG: 3-deoxy-8-phosphooctulonate synthase [Acidobacteriota bacterium]|nr:3-deoxy-8-phosphooctulonate synthase [Acidobacteriota bacterium]